MDKAITKVRRLLSLARSTSSKNEALTAYDIAEQIVIRYNLDAEMFEND